MKQKFYSGAVALALIGLASCSSENGVDVKNPEAVGDKYVAVQIHSVGSNGTRAAGEGYEEGINSEDGLAGESVIKPENCRFFFFDADKNPYPLSSVGVNGTVTQTNMVTPLELGTINNTDGTCDINGILVLGIDENNGYKGVAPSLMICLANLYSVEGGADTNPYSAFENLNIDDFFGKMTTQVSGNALPTDKFPMSNSTYKLADGSTIYWTDLDGCIKTTMEAAKQSPAHVYLERLYAKVRVEGEESYVSKNADLTDAEYSFENADGTTTNKKIVVTVDGWRLRNVFNRVRILKQIDSSVTGAIPNFDFNDLSNHRSYWAVTGGETSKLSQNSFNIYNDTQVYGEYYDSSKGFLQNNERYILPSTYYWKQPNYDNTISEQGFATTGTNAYNKPISNRVTNTTAVVVKAHINIQKEGDNPDYSVGDDIVYWSGAYYEVDVFKERVLKAYKGMTGANQSYTTDNVFIESFRDIKENGNITGGTGKTQNGNNTRKVYVAQSKESDSKTYITGYDDVKYWEDGLCSFYVNIQHAKDKNDNTPIFGIVRNHIYNVNFTDIIGLGVPGNDIKNPEKETETFLACHIDVLNWKIVSNNIVLE